MKSNSAFRQNSRITTQLVSRAHIYGQQVNPDQQIICCALEARSTLPARSFRSMNPISPNNPAPVRVHTVAVASPDGHHPCRRPSAVLVVFLFEEETRAVGDQLE